MESYGKDLICAFTELLSQLRILHWQTKSFARHIAYEKVYDSLEDYADDFIEIYQGKHGRIRLSCQPQLFNVDEDIENFIDNHINYLSNDLPITEDDVDLLAIRDEMVGQLNKLKYLLTLD
jgi:hypothetical protein